MISRKIPLVLNERWRVVADDVQWILEFSNGAPTAKSTGWRSRSFCRSKEGLRRRIGELCGSIDPEAEIALADLPEWHS